MSIASNINFITTIVVGAEWSTIEEFEEAILFLLPPETGVNTANVLISNYQLRISLQIAIGNFRLTDGKASIQRVIAFHMTLKYVYENIDYSRKAHVNIARELSKISRAKSNS